MAVKTYIGVGDTAKSVSKIYVGVGDVAKQVKKAYVGDADGLAQLVYQYHTGSYTMLEYIQGDGASYIDTGISCYKASNKNYWVSFKPSGTGYLFGNRGGSGNAYYAVHVNSGTNLRFFAGTQNTTSPTATTSVSAQSYYSARLKCQTNGVVVCWFAVNDGTETMLKDVTPSYAGGNNAYLLALNNLGTASDYGQHYIYYWRVATISPSANTVWAYPARRNSDNAVGLYDTIGGTFYENQGTGTFIAGPETGEYY